MTLINLIREQTYLKSFFVQVKVTCTHFQNFISGLGWLILTLKHTFYVINSNIYEFIVEMWNSNIFYVVETKPVNMTLRWQVGGDLRLSNPVGPYLMWGWWHYNIYQTHPLFLWRYIFFSVYIGMIPEANIMWGSKNGDKTCTIPTSL